MRFWFVVVAILFSSLSLWAEQPYYGKVYVDRENEDWLSVYTDPGVDYDVCAQNKGCAAVGWLDNRSEVEIVSPPRVYPSYDSIEKKVIDKEYVQVVFSYDRINPDGKRATKKNVVGWVETASLKKQKFATFFGSDPEPAECPPTVVSKPSYDPKKQAADLKRAADNQHTVATADAITPYIGKCVVNPKALPAKYTGEITYDTYVMPHMSKQAVPNLKKEGGKTVTQEDMVDIDALARTMYAEMAGCYRHGLHYPSAVARISLNRANAPGRRAEFIHGPHKAGKGDISKAVTSNYKYSAWNRTLGDGSRNNSLTHALCPPAPMNNVMWTGKPATPAEKEIWKNTIRIATEAVLFPSKFKSRSSGFNQLFYTSGMGRDGWRQVYPKIEGRAIDRNSCMQVWQD